MSIKFYWVKQFVMNLKLILTVDLMNFDLLSCYVKKVYRRKL